MCFQSTVPFKSVQSPTIAEAGVGALLACAETANKAPCVSSVKQLGVNVVVRFEVPGGDPRFHIVAPAHPRFGTSGLPKGKIGKSYAGQLNVSGGLAPLVWKITAGKLPPGLRLMVSTGHLTGKPTKAGRYAFTVQANDAESPPETARLAATITITS